MPPPIFSADIYLTRLFFSIFTHFSMPNLSVFSLMVYNLYILSNCFSLTRSFVSLAELSGEEEGE